MTDIFPKELPAATRSRVSQMAEAFLNHASANFSETEKGATPLHRAARVWTASAANAATEAGDDEFAGFLTSILGLPQFGAHTLQTFAGKSVTVPEPYVPGGKKARKTYI